MKTIHRLRATGRLTETQMLTAFRFYRNPNTFTMAPSTFRILREIIIDEIPLEVLEERRGWSARSAKVVLSVLLNSIEEIEGDFWPMDDDKTDTAMAEIAEYFLDGDQTETLRIQETLGLSNLEARVLRLLLAKFGSPVSYQAITEATYFDRDAPSDPDGIMKTRIAHIRRRIAKLGLQIKTMHNAGYVLYSDGEDASIIGDLKAMILGDGPAPVQGKAAP